VSIILQYFNNTGIVLSGGTITTYEAGTSTPQTTYTDSTGGTSNANPITLNASGRLNNVAIWQPAGVAIKAVIADAIGNQIAIIDQIAGINDFTNPFASLADAKSGSGADLIANAMRSYDILTSLRAANVPTMATGQTLIIGLQGSVTTGDQGGGLFFWNAGSTATDDSVNVIKPNALISGSPGRYIRLIQLGVLAFNANLTGMSATIQGAITQEVNGNLVTLYLTTGTITGTSNSTSFGINNLPTLSQPIKPVIIPCFLEDNSQLIGGWASISGGTITFGTGINNNTSGFTASGFKGLPAGWQITYAKS
jgi:hypothetical protein